MFNYLFIIPVRNEENILEQNITLLVDFIQKWQEKTGPINIKVIIADNGSTDRTKQIAAQLTLRHGNLIDYIFTDKIGRGYALRYVAENFSSDYYLYVDADLPLHLEDLVKILGPLEQNTADVVVGRRQGKRPLKRKIFTRGLKIINKIFFDLNVTDAQCGIKAFNSKAGRLLVDHCQESGYFLDTEFLVLSKYQGLIVKEIPVHWIEQRHKGRKSKTRLGLDTIRAMKTIFKLKRRVRKLTKSE